MRATIPLLAIISSFALTGCIIYDHECKGCESGYEWETEDTDTHQSPDTADTVDTDTEDTDIEDTDTQDSGLLDTDVVTWSYALDPAEAEAGQVFIGSLRSTGENPPPYSDIASLHFYGDLTVLAGFARDSEYLVTLSVSDEAVEGPVDLVVEYTDGSALWIDDVLTLYAKGSGHEATGSGDPCK